ncbi:myb/SANT-like DNA-binding domain-containing protein 2 isoform X4 [Hyperolius riggenbachi]|uniref:myb/SANT-like DNA-binding domain-containing protein 2 isoform X4 n=1 Tax=Hyperolius riggenbachi TaxID=752182 RepID=UPI0035A2F388
MAAPCNSELPSEASSCLKIPKNELMSPASPGLKIPKNELMSPASPGLSDGNRSVSNPSTPNCSSPLTAGAGLPAPSYSTAACRGMSWTPAETNALIAVWGNERLVEARYQQLEGAGTIFGTKSPGPAMYDRVSRALAELGYERTPSQCRERMKTLRRCYSRVKERGFGKRKSSYTFEQLERVFGQGGWDTQPCQPVLINSSGLYQEMESDGSTMEDYSLEDWGNQSQEIQGFPGEELEEISIPKRPPKSRDPVEEIQKRDVLQTIMHILESVQLKWELFQSWTDFSRLHLSNKLAIFGIGYNTRWKEDIRYHYAEISSQVPLGKRLREYFNPEKPEGRVIMTRVQKMNWKNVYYKFLEITISEARCLELHMETDWIPIAHSKPIGGDIVQYLLPGGIPKCPGLYAIGYEELRSKPVTDNAVVDLVNDSNCDSPSNSEPVPPKINYCYLGIAESITLQQCLFFHFQSTIKNQNAWLLHTRNVRASISPSICADLTLALLEVHVEQKFVTTVQGQSITLPIWYSSSSDFRPYVSWYIKREQSEQEPIITYMDGAISVYPAFTGRLNFAHPMPSKNVSITINRTLASDTGEYRCYILVHGEPIEGSSSIGVIDVSILVPPSKPTCQLQGDSYIGANVTLICRSSTGQPKPTYSWIKKAASKLVFFSPAQDSVKGTLTLTNISRDNSGTYVCISKNTAGVTECNINMQVTSASRVAIIVGAVVGSIVGLCWVAILIAVFIYLYRRQKKEAQDETENDIREDAAAPKSLTWTKANGSDLGFKNGTLSSLNSNQKPYPPKSPSDTTSINTATGSTTAFRPPYITDRGRVTTPTPSMTSQSLPTYMAPSNGNYYTTAVPASGGGAAPKPNEVEHRAPRKELNITSGVTPSNLVRMGAVPVMVPAQSQAGSLV